MSIKIAKKTELLLFLVTMLVTLNLHGQVSSGKNYLLKQEIKKSMVTAPFQVLGLTAPEVSRQVQYLDGLGRTVQVISIGGSPSGQDIIQPVVYDAFGRESRKYQAYTAFTGNHGQFRVSALGEQSNFYTAPPTGIKSTSYPFAETVFEASALNRIAQQGAPGASWQISSGHTQQIVYSSNTAQNGNSAVKLYRAVATGTDHSRILSDGGWYSAGQLSLTITKDENWAIGDGQVGTVEEYKDKEEKVVLKRMFNRKDDNSIETLSTYYVYDDFGNLSFVLPPGAEADSGLPDATVLNNYCYQYSYDGLKRLIEKKLPGAATIAMVYNKRDQLVLSQDGNQRGRQEWGFIRYDGLGRAIMTGIYSNGGTRASLQAALESETVMFDNRNNALTFGYTTNSYPSASFSPLTISYYDDYDFPGNSFGQPVSGQANGDEVKGQLTGTKIWTLESTPQVLLSVNYYNDEGRIVDLKSTNHLGGTDIQHNTYSFVGEILTSTRTHTANGTSTVIANRYGYDHAGRKLKTYQKINSDPEVLLSESIYNEIGQLTEKKLHDGLQSTRYNYNERGWLKESSSAQLNIKLGYDTLSTPQYNGNIATQEWGAVYGNKYLYNYDKLNRLKAGISSGISMSEVLSYDKLGNISLLSRDGGTANTYHYSGNRLTAITGGLTTGTYEYDVAGNAVKDGRNGVSIGYNMLNLPSLVSKDGLSMTYTYDAAGNKLRKISGSTVTDYVVGIQYLNGTIDFIRTEVGLARRNGSGYTYEYTLTDHLGNTRVTFYRNPSTGSLEVLQKDDYYSFGMRKQALAASNDNKYLYNGKELQDELGQLDYGARFYDPVIGRWSVIDPLSELDRKTSPYAYVFNNPMTFIDPDGMKGESTHTDMFGNVLGIYNDGDLGVYRHKDISSRGEMDHLYYASKAGTSLGGEYMGETWTPFGFADFGYFEKYGVNRDGSVEIAAGARIDFTSSFATDEVRAIVKANPSAYEYSKKAGSGGDWDIKSHTPDGKPYFGSLLWGKYASARDAGNIAAGIVAESSNFPTILIDYGFGLYNQSGNNKKVAIGKGFGDSLLGTVSPLLGIGNFLRRAFTGEDKLTRYGINAGKKVFH